MRPLCLPAFLLLTLGLHAAPKPNVVFILADDLGARDLSNTGSTYYETPHLDQLAAMGTQFTRGYATCQVCSPSRASILTGKYPVNHGITNYLGAPVGEDWRRFGRQNSLLPPAYAPGLRATELTLAEVFRDAGYRTFFAGKWHLGEEGDWPTAHGFEINQGGHRAGGPGKGGFFSPYQNPRLKDGPPGESLTLRLGQETAGFIRAHKDEPFLAYLSFYTVHAPIQTTQELWKKYRDKAVAQGLPENRFLWDRRLPVRQVQDCPTYAGMVETMDDAVGLVLQELEQQGLMDRTIICFTSDNGGVSSGDAYATSNLPLRGGKGRQWEGGIREPFYLYAPGVSRPMKTAVPASGIDWYPTLLELAGVPLPEEQAVDGVSLVPVLKGGSLPDRPLFWHYPHYGNQGGEPSSIIMEGDWKLIWYHEDQRKELYHLGRDIGEQQDLAQAEPARREAMFARLQAWLKHTNAPMPDPDPQYRAERFAARMERMQHKLQPRLEKQHAEYLEEDYRPNPTWWGSSPASPKTP